MDLYFEFLVLIQNLCSINFIFSVLKLHVFVFYLESLFIGNNLYVFNLWLLARNV